MIIDEDDGVVIEEEPHERALREFISALNAPEAGYRPWPVSSASTLTSQTRMKVHG